MGKNHVCMLSLGLLLGSCSGGEANLPYGPVQLMMANEVQPTAEGYWDSVRFVSELVDGEPVFTEYEPKTEEDWQKVEQAARHLGELGEALKTPAYSDGRGADWLVFAQGMVDVAKLAEDAAKSRDPDQVFEVGGTVYNVCSACHQQYPPAQMPPEEASGEQARDASANTPE